MHTTIAVMAIAMVLLVGNTFGLNWETPPVQFVKSPLGSFFDLARDPFGNAFSAYDTGSHTLSVSRFSRSLGAYEPAVILSSGNEILNVSIATDASRTALIVWQDTIPGQIFTALYNGKVWSLPAPLAAVSNLSSPEITMNGLGNGLVVWADDVIMSSFFDRKTRTWSPPHPLSTTAGTSPTVAFSSNGTAVVLWNDDADNIMASSFNGKTWETPLTIGTNGQMPQIGIDRTGCAIATWFDNETSMILSSFFTQGNWESPIPVSIKSVSPEYQLAMSDNGSAMIIWTDFENRGFYSEWNKGSWTLLLPFATHVGYSTLAVDSNGNALIGWENGKQTYSIYKPFLKPFGSPNLVSANSNDLLPLQSALSDSGFGFIDGISESNQGTGITGNYTNGRN